MANKFYSNEIVFRGHPDKVADQISDALLDAYLKEDPYTRAGIEVLGGKGSIFVTGEVTSSANVDVQGVVKRVLSDVGYSTEYDIVNNIGRQSPDIAKGVDVGGAGDQGMMFGYACSQTDKLLPKAMCILQELSRVYDDIVRKYSQFGPDGKAQITGEYNDNFELIRIKTFTVSYQNNEEDRTETDSIIINTIDSICKKYGVSVDEYLINPAGRFELGGFDADAGLTGRKIVVDAYQSFANVGGGAYSGKDPTKVDRSAAYKARQIAKRYLKMHNLQWCEVQISYAIGVAEPLAIYITSNEGSIYPNPTLYKECIPENIISEFNLRLPQFEETAKFGHYGNLDFAWEKHIEPPYGVFRK